ncbi:MAG: 4-hydroxy-tetrahydrodipicolinate synthase [Ruminiclostridium sp.]
MKTPIFTGAGVAIITPMNADGSINYDEFGRIIDNQIENGTDAIIVCGTTGEASTMTDEEHIEAIRFTVDRVAKRVPVIAGTGSNDTGYAIELSKQAEAVGADALLQVTPYYNKTSQRGLVAHFTAIADAVNIPIILYNVPSRTGVSISIETYIECAKHPNIVAVKEASGNFSLAAKIAAHTDLVMYSGNDDQVLALLALGAKGVISVSSNVIPREKHDMVALYLAGEHEKALELQKKYLDMENAMFIDVNPIPVKEAMNMIGWNAGECRLPLCRMEEEKIAKLRNELEKVGLIK